MQCALTSNTPAHEQGDPEADAAAYQVYFRATLRQPEHLDTLVRNLRANVTNEGILKARDIEDRLFDQTLRASGYDLLPKLQQLDIPTLVIHGDYDFIPIAAATRIAGSIPGARFVLLKDCGHFSYLECPDEVRKALTDFFPST